MKTILVYLCVVINPWACHEWENSQKKNKKKNNSDHNYPSSRPLRRGVLGLEREETVEINGPTLQHFRMRRHMAFSDIELFDPILEPLRTEFRFNDFSMQFFHF